jgi:hypothetical protein
MSARRHARWLALAASALLLAAPATGIAADASRPHLHRGLVAPFDGRPEIRPLVDKQRAALARGDTILVTLEGDEGGRGMAIQDVHASAEIIWGRIGAFAEYPRMVPHVEECEIYHAEGDDVRVRFLLSVMSLEYEYYIQHAMRTDEGYVTWTLDYTRESDLDDSVGYWSVFELPDRPGWSRLFYSIDMRTRGWMPGFLRDMIANRGLKDATAWVKREAEATRKSHEAGTPATGARADAR